jgi:hypothetical protein
MSLCLSVTVTESQRSVRLSLSLVCLSQLTRPNANGLPAGLPGRKARLAAYNIVVTQSPKLTESGKFELGPRTRALTALLERRLTTASACSLPRPKRGGVYELNHSAFLEA